MHTLIAGGTGLIGRALTASFVADGHQVVILSRTPDRVTALPAGVHVERWDAHTAEGWAHLAEGTDAIVNLAGESIGAGRWTAERKKRIRESRLNAGRAVVQAVELAAQKPRVIVQSSGVGYYGPQGDQEIAEDAPPGDDFLGRLAQEWESSTAPVEALGVRRVIIRTSAVLSTDGGIFPRLLLPFHLFVGGPLGGGRQWVPWIHLADQVAAIRFLIENEAAGGPFNLTAPNPLTNADFVQAVGRAMGRPAFLPTPGFVMRLVLGEMATLLLDGQRAVPRRLLELDFQFRFPTAEAALKDLLR
jgi:uncharacterized protein (TIGR01777 family)